MRILVTGGGGFIGHHLVHNRLKAGDHVRTVDLQFSGPAADLDHPCLERVIGSIVDPALCRELVAGIDIIFHLASAHLDVTLSEEVYRAVNVEASLELAHRGNEAGVKRFVHVSTNGVVGEITDPPVDETAVCRPTNIYEQTKLEGERAVLDYGRGQNLPVVIIRPSWVYGPGCPRTGRLLRAIGKGRFVMFGNGRTLRHPLYIDDLIAGLGLAAASNRAVGEIYFIAGEKAVTLNELAGAIAAVQGVPPPRLRLPLWVGQLAVTVVAAGFKPLRKQPPVSPRTLDFFTKDNAYDISKARRELGFTPRVDLIEGLQRTLQAAAG